MASTNMMRVVRARARWAVLRVKLCHTRVTRRRNRAREHGLISSPLPSSSLHLERNGKMRELNSLYLYRGCKRDTGMCVQERGRDVRERERGDVRPRDRERD